MSTPEGRVKAKVNRALDETFGRRCYRFMPVQSGYGKAGVDYHCSITDVLGRPGLPVFIETKIEGKDLSPRQEFTRDTIIDAGGLFYVIRNQHDIDAMIHDINLELRRRRVGTR